MKQTEQFLQDLYARRDAYEAHKRKMRKRVTRCVAAGMTCLCLAGGVWFGTRDRMQQTVEPPLTAESAPPSVQETPSQDAEEIFQVIAFAEQTFRLRAEVLPESDDSAGQVGAMLQQKMQQYAEQPDCCHLVVLSGQDALEVLVAVWNYQSAEVFNCAGEYTLIIDRVGEPKSTLDREKWIFETLDRQYVCYLSADEILQCVAAGQSCAFVYAFDEE